MTPPPTDRSRLSRTRHLSAASRSVVETLECRRLLATFSVDSGERLTNEVAPGDTDTIEFALNTGDLAILGLQDIGGVGISTNSRPRIIVTAPDGSELVDANTSTGRDDEIVAKQTGTYTASIRDDNLLDPINYGFALLTITSPLSDGDTTRIDDQDDGDRILRSGERLTGTIDSPGIDFDLFFVEASAGDRFIFGLQDVGGIGISTNSQPRVNVYAPSGGEILDVNTGTGRDDLVIAPETGTYQVLVRDNNGADPANYALSLLTLTSPLEDGEADRVADQDDGDRTLTNDEQVTGSIDFPGTDLDLYFFDAVEGDSVTVELENFGGVGIPTNSVPRLTIYEPSGGQAVNFTAFTQSDRTFAADETGTYYAMVRDNDAGDLSNYGLTVSGLTEVPDNEGPTITSLIINPNPILPDGSTVFTATGVNDNDGTVTGVEFFFDGNSLGTDTDGSDGYSVEFSPADDFDAGDYIVTAVATDDDDATATVTNTLTISEPAVNQPPTIGGLLDSPDPVVSGELLRLAIEGNNVVDPDGADDLVTVDFFLQVDGEDDIFVGNATTGTGFFVDVDTTDAAPGEYTYYAVATDGEGATSGLVFTTSTVVEPTIDNLPPTIGGLDVTPNVVFLGELPATVDLIATGLADADGSVDRVDFFEVDFSTATPTNVLLGSAVPTGNAATFAATTPTVGGTTTYVAVAFDDDGDGSVEVSTLLSILPERGPTITSFTATPATITPGESVTLDLDGDRITGVTFLRQLPGEAVEEVGSVDSDTADLAVGTLFRYSAIATAANGETTQSQEVTVEVVPEPVEDDVAFTFLDAGADVRLFQIVDGATYQRSDLPGNLSIQADNINAEAESVAFRLEGPDGLVYENTENISFYTLFRNVGTSFEGSGDVLGDVLPAGTYTLTATSYTADDAGGSVDEVGSVTFTIADIALSLQVVDTAADTIDGPLVDGGSYAAADFSVVATPSAPASVRSVQYVLRNELGGLIASRVENIAPYALFANNGFDYFGEPVTTGRYTLEVRPFTGEDATGFSGPVAGVSFELTA
jgi:hypothetical protein